MVVETFEGQRVRAIRIGGTIPFVVMGVSFRDIRQISLRSFPESKDCFSLTGAAKWKFTVGYTARKLKRQTSVAAAGVSVSRKLSTRDPLEVEFARPYGGGLGVYRAKT